MADTGYVDEYIKKYKPALIKAEKYIKENDWTLLGDIEITKGRLNNPKKEEYAVQDQSVLNLIDRLKFFAKKASGQHRTPQFKKYVKHVMKVIIMHMDRVDRYINGVSLEEIKSTDLKKEEMEFHNLLQKRFNVVDDAVEALNLKFEDIKSTDTIEFLNDQKAPLSMHEVLSSIYPEINEELKNRGISFEVEPDNELLINHPNPPIWNTDLHYWQQEKETLIFYIKEFEKIKNGVVVDGVYISPWAYYHMNVFVTPIPHKVWNEKQQDFKSVDKIINPPLRDSDWMIFENRALQERTKTLFMFIAATRRAAKTTVEASMLGHAATIGLKELLCAGASAKDLGQVSKNFKIDMLHKNPAFAVYNVTNDWTTRVELGIKNKSNKTIPLCTLNIINTDSGNNTEIFAGFTPDLVVVDEAMKSFFLEALEGLLPAMRGADGTIRAFGILSGTGGSDALSADGLKALNDPETYKILPMQWDILERGVAEEYINWKEDKLKPFGTFIPGNCRVDMPKISSTLAEYLGKPESKGLGKIKILLTDWKKSTELIHAARDAVSKDKLKLQKEVTYAPLTPTDIFASGNINRFPVLEAKRHKQHLLESGEWDRRREIFRDSNGKVQWAISTRDLADFPHKGGVVEAPCLLFEDPPEHKPVWGTYTAGFDDFASEESDSDSVATFTIMKNEILGDPFSKRIVATLSFRPGKHTNVWDKWLMLMELYHLDGTCFGENFNYEIKTHLDRYHLSEKYLAPSLDFSANFTIPNNGKRKTGWNPTTTKRFLFDLFVEYCNESFDVEMEDGSTKIIKGVQLIDDIYLLDEIIQYSPNLNVDRITSAMGALGYGFFLRSSQRWKVLNYSKDKEDNTPKVRKERAYNPYSRGSRKPSFYGKKR